MGLFAGFFGAAVKWRRHPETHKRLMVLATVALLFAAVGRMEDFVPSVPLLMTIWLSPVLAAMAHELVTRRAVHRVYVLGLFVLAVAPARLLLETSDAWLPIGRGILRVFM